MDTESAQKSPFEDYKISMEKIVGCPCCGQKTRAVVRLSGGIGPELERISRLIEGCRYNPESNTSAFCQGSIIVCLKHDEISMLGIRDESDAHKIIKMIKKKAENNNETMHGY